MATYEILGSIAILKPSDKIKRQKLLEAKELLEKPNINTVVEQMSNVKGRLRTIKTSHLAGVKTKETVIIENNCRFKLNIDTCYYTARLSNERKANAEMIKKNQEVLVMFAGVGPFPITIYKIARPKKIVAVEIGKDCCKYFKENLRLNKVPDGAIEVVQGDVKKKISGKEKYDVIIMARPNLKDTFLETALKASKKNTLILYHLFCHENDLKKELARLEDGARECKRKIKIKKVMKIGNIAPYKYRHRVEIKVLN